MQTLGEKGEYRQLRCNALRELGTAAQGNHAIRGAALGLLYGDGQLDARSLAASFRGHLLGAGSDGEGGAHFLRGLLRTARSAIWQVDEIVAELHATLGAMAEEQFIHQLPLLRLAFADLTPRETDQVATVVAKHAGVARLDVAQSASFAASEMVIAVAVEMQLKRTLERDGLSPWPAEEHS